MIQYWSWWNLSWWLSSELGLVNKSNSLKSSIIVTSLVGGYMTYIYPRRIIIRMGRYKYAPNYTVLVIGDFFVHQVPLLFILCTPRERIENNCGAEVLIPFGMWGIINYYKQTKVDKLYGIKMYKLVTTSSLLLGGYGIYYHFLQKKN